MRIDSGNIGMDSARLYRSSKTTSTSVEISVSGNALTGSQLTSAFSSFLPKDGNSNETEMLQETGTPKTTENGKEEDPLLALMERLSSPTKTKIYSSMPKERDTFAEFQKMHERFLSQVLETLFKKKVKKQDGDDCACDLNEDGNSQFSIPEEKFEVATISLTNSTFYEEMEYTTFNAQGMVKTDDGREINVGLSFEMSQRFMSCFSESYSLMESICVDPLVVNLHDAPASLSDLKFFFDLDGDGTKEEISSLGEGSGFLALDKNNDGIINDGTELFGTKSGDGFKDLSIYDEDHNGWIDENDSIFEKLRIWTKDLEGNDLLYTLKDKDIGAIYLGNTDTQYALKGDPGTAPNGYIRKTGVFLYESGAAGTLQHVDLSTGQTA